METLLSALANPKLCHERARDIPATPGRGTAHRVYDEVSTTRVHGSTELPHSSIYSRVPSGHRVPAAAAPGCKTARRARGCLAEDLGCQRRPAARQPRARFAVRGDLAPRPCGRGMNCGTRQQKLHSWTNAVRAAVSTGGRCEPRRRCAPPSARPYTSSRAKWRAVLPQSSAWRGK